MSHSSGAVKFNDGEIWFYEYNGTTDVVISNLRKTLQEVRDNWRESEWLECTCGKAEPVEIYSDYGGGFCFNGKACRKCRSVDGGECYPYTFDGIPDWASKFFAR